MEGVSEEGQVTPGAVNPMMMMMVVMMMMMFIMPFRFMLVGLFVHLYTVLVCIVHNDNGMSR
jgi:hypothetical protein